MKKEIEKYFDRLWPINRSLTGNGNRETLRILSEIVDLTIDEVPCGTSCFDWVIPPEWNVREAWIKNERGEKIVDFANHNLHLMGYSTPIAKRMSLQELRPNLYSLPDQPDLIPYLTSYYKERWGFCVPHNQLATLPDEIYEVFIDSELNSNGSMTVAEAVLKGRSEQEILISTYICHPSMANNELSGPLVAAFIYRELKKTKNRLYTYRFAFVPETIGSIYYLSKYGQHFKEKLAAGYVITCIGDPGPFTLKKSRRQNSLADRCAETVLGQTEINFSVEEFFPNGSDERQYCSPGFNLPVASLMRTRYGRYPQYHTSGDNKDFISFDALERSVNKYLEIVALIEKNLYYKNLMPFCEPQLGKRGLYPTLSTKNTRDLVEAMMWVLNLADGSNDLIDISQRSKKPVSELIPIVEKLLDNGILAAPSLK